MMKFEEMEAILFEILQIRINNATLHVILSQNYLFAILHKCTSGTLTTSLLVNYRTPHRVQSGTGILISLEMKHLSEPR